MDFERLLSVGALTQILEGSKPVDPVLQIIGYKPMTSDQIPLGGSTDELRYRLMIGDGEKSHQYCVITNQELVDDIRNGRLEKWSIVKVTSYQTNDMGDGPPENRRRLIYILNLEIIKKGSEVGRKLAVQRPSSTVPDPVTQPQPYPMSNHQDYSNTPRYGNNIMRSSHDQHTIGIGELTPYIGKWVVKGRVTSKSQIREYNNARGGGKLFNFSMADKTGEIKVTAFNADCDRFYAYVDPNKVYLLGRATVKNADKRYTTADFEITLNNDSLLEEVPDSKEDDIPLAKFNFISIAKLVDVPPNHPVDLIGAITQVSDVNTIVSKTKNKELKKRNITIVDMSRHSISVTIWDSQAESFTGAVGDVFVNKSARIGTYGGRSASAGDCLFINPDIPEARKVKNWYSNLLDSNFTSLTAGTDSTGSGEQWKELDEMLDLGHVRELTSSGTTSALYFKTKALLLSVGKNPVYKTCPEGCGKKLVDTQNGELKCDKCQQTYTNYKYRYKTDIEISDRSSSAWVTLWDEKAEAIFKMKPDELAMLMRQETNKDAYEKIITQANFNFYTLTLRARIDTYNNEERVKLQAVNIAPLEIIPFGKRLIEEIKAVGAA